MEQSVLLVGGPEDQLTVDVEESVALYEAQAGNTVHRYVRTPSTREFEGRELPVFNYDGQVYEQASAAT